MGANWRLGAYSNKYGMFQRDDEWSVLFKAQHQALNRLFLFLLVRNHSVEKKGFKVDNILEYMKNYISRCKRLLSTVTAIRK